MPRLHSIPYCWNLVLIPTSDIRSLQDNLSRGNMGAVRVLQRLFPQPGRLQFIYADLGDAKAVSFV